MANTLDPPIEQVPSQLLENHDMRIYFEELQRWRFDVFVKLGEGNDPVSDSEEFSIEDTSPRMEEIEVISTSTNFTTTGTQVIICTNTADIDITLNLTPDDGEQLHIKMQNTGKVSIIGAIDGQTILTVRNRYDAPHLIFTVDAGEFSII